MTNIDKYMTNIVINTSSKKSVSPYPSINVVNLSLILSIIPVIKFSIFVITELIYASMSINISSHP